jgi:uncharacterized protein (DUF885 family)
MLSVTLATLVGLWGPIAVSVTAQPGSPGVNLTESERLNAWFQEAFQEELAHSPQGQTSLGMIEDLDAYGRWDDGSDDAARAAFERREARLAEMRERFDFDALSDAAKLSYRFFEFQQELAERLFEVRESAYVFSPIRDAVSGLTSFLINNHRVNELAHAEAYLSRLQGMAAQIDEMVARAEARAEADVRLPLFAYPRLIKSAEALISGAPFDDGEDGPLLADFRTKVGALEIGEADANALIQRAEHALTSSYQPAIDRYITSLRAMQADADERAGAWKLPAGDDFYTAQVRFFTTRTDLTPAEIHQIGLDDVARIQSEMRDIMATVGFEGSLQDFFAFLRTDDQFYHPDTPEGRRAYIDEATAIIDRVMDAAPEYFGALPQAALEVRAVEPYREATATGAFYSRPALDGSRPGYYYINLSGRSIAAIYLMESLAYHEGAPGHHFQIALAQEVGGLPLFQRTTGYSAFIEGWALYAEQLGKDMGFFTDPYQDFGRLSFELFRAARLVVDTGIHHHRGTREEAVDYMLANTPMTEDIIGPEVERYIVWPGQALSYKIGMMTILDLRERARNELGEDFSWAGFHDAVLTSGSLPLPLLEERVEAWIADVRAAR